MRCQSGTRSMALGRLGAGVEPMDDDMEPVPDCLAAHRRAHAGRPRLAVFGAVPIDMERARSPVEAYVGAKFNRHLEKLAQPGYRFGARDVYTGNVSI